MQWRTRIAALAAVAMLTSMSGAAGAMASKACRGADLRARRSSLATAANATLCLIDKLRRAHHLRPLRMNATLRAIASGQSHDMLAGGYFGDNSLNGLTPMQRVQASPYAHGSSRLTVGQNIAWGEGRDSTPASIVRAWMSSPPHREILLSPIYREAGVGIVLGALRSTRGRFAAIYTLDLATLAA
jgi:uncharacterized protein YkwD